MENWELTFSKHLETGDNFKKRTRSWTTDYVIRVDGYWWMSVIISVAYMPPFLLRNRVGANQKNCVKKTHVAITPEKKLSRFYCAPLWASLTPELGHLWMPAQSSQNRPGIIRMVFLMDKPRTFSTQPSQATPRSSRNFRRSLIFSDRMSISVWAGNKSKETKRERRRKDLQE